MGRHMVGRYYQDYFTITYLIFHLPHAAYLISKYTLTYLHALTEPRSLPYYFEVKSTPASLASTTKPSNVILSKL